MTKKLKGPRVAIVVGHTQSSQGAVRKTDGVQEWAWNRGLAHSILKHNPSMMKIFYRVDGGGYSSEIDKVYAQIDEWGATCSLELHFNGAHSERAKGTLTLSSGSKGSLKLAGIVQAAMHGVMQIEDDGVEVRHRGARGGRALHQGAAPAVLLEPYFGSRKKSCRIADQYKDELAEAIYRAVCEYEGVTLSCS